MKKALSWTLVAATISLLLLLAFNPKESKASNSHTNSTTNPSAVQTVRSQNPKQFSSSEHEKWILEDSLPAPLFDDLEPVIIYEVSVSQGTQRFAASGACSRNSLGETVLLTAAHIFFKREHPTAYFLRRISPVADQPSWWVSEVHFVEGADIAVGKIVPMKESAMPIITAACDPALNPMGRELVGNMFPVSAFDKEQKALLPTIIRSLANGERVPICGMLQDHSGCQYLIGESCSFPGRSGTGYVDEQGNLYLLTGSRNNIRSEVMHTLGITNRCVTIFTTKLTRVK